MDTDNLVIYKSVGGLEMDQSASVMVLSNVRLSTAACAYCSTTRSEFLHSSLLIPFPFFLFFFYPLFFLGLAVVVINWRFSNYLFVQLFAFYSTPAINSVLRHTGNVTSRVRVFWS
jgi:hypothetical protein